MQYMQTELPEKMAGLMSTHQEPAEIEVATMASQSTRAGQVRKLVRKSANPQLQTNEKSCGLADFGSLNCGLAVADYF